MTVAEIFSEISAHMIEGMMFHSQMIQYYDFLGLPGYAKDHYKHYKSESKAWVKLCRHYTVKHNALLKDSKVSDPKAIPEQWYKHVRSDVDNNTKRNAVRSGLERWALWEDETKSLYQKMYAELMDIGEIDDAIFFQDYVRDVSNELCQVEWYLLSKKAEDYNLSDVISEQKH